MRTSIRLRGRTRLSSPLAAAALVAVLVSSLGAAAPVAAQQARHVDAHAGTAGAVLAAPARSAAQAPVRTDAVLPADTCSLAGTTRTCDLYAETGVMPASALPGAPAAGVPVWGYGTTSGAVTAPGGPTLIAHQGETLVVNLHNVNIPSATSLMVAGLPVVPDIAGVTAGSAKTYTFAASTPGTYLYEAGLTPDGPRQAAMGLYGALIVRPGAAGQAYGDASTAFDDEAVLVLGEIDPTFARATTDSTPFDFSHFSPTYWLINGQVYQTGAPVIATDAGHRVLLRYVNAGLGNHSMSLLGLHQLIVASDAQPAVHQAAVVAETVPAGGTLDTIATIAPTAAAGSRYALFEAAMHLDNSGVSTSGVIDYGGMLTFLAVAGSSSGSGGPVTSAVTLSPNPTNGSVSVALGATVTASTGANVTAAEYFVDVKGANGTGTAMGGTFGGATAGVTATLSTSQLAALASGNHTIYVHGQDSSGTGTWGAVSSAVLNLDKTGPSIGNMSLTPSQTNGTADVALQATASDVASGNQNVVAAEYFIDPVGTPANGSGTAFTPMPAPATSVSLAATIPAATVLALGEGAHAVSVRARDFLGNWGALTSVTLNLDTTGPATSAVAAIPNPNNGTLGVQVTSGGAFYERVDATVIDSPSHAVSSNIVTAEYYIDTDPGIGKGGAMFATDGVFSGSTEHVFAAIDLYAIAALTPGNHTIFVRGKDAAGNWGSTSSGTLVIDKAAPTVSGVTLAPPAANAQAVTVTASATDVATGNSTIAGGELFIDAVGAAGTGTAMTAGAASPSTTISGSITAARVAALTAGPHTVYVRARDAAGNWGATASAVLLIDRTAPTISNVTVSPSPTVGAASVTAVVTAADNAGGSGLNGGDYWIDGTTTPPAGRIAFAGTSSPITVAGINVAALTAGSHNLRVRVKDAAGNFSPVFTRSFTVSLARPTVIKAFAGAVRGGLGSVVQRTTTLTITLANSNATAATGAALTDNLPQPAAGTLTVVTSATTCGGTTSTANSSRRLLLNGGTIPASGSCTVTATVRMSAAATNGPYTLTNTILAGGLTTSNAGSNQVAASAVLTVNP